MEKINECEKCGVQIYSDIYYCEKCGILLCEDCINNKNECKDCEGEN